MSVFQSNEEMRVLKRDGSIETVAFDKILTRVRRLGNEANLKINYTSLAMKVIDQLYDLISTTKIDELCADQCAALASTHPDYNILAGRIVVSNHQKNTSCSFSEVMCALYEFRDIHGNPSPMISKDLYDLVIAKGATLDLIPDYNRDYLIDYFGFKTLEKSYLMRIGKRVVERPQHMWLRVSLAIHLESSIADLEPATETYRYMSQKYFTHATPTLFNAGTPRPQLSSCFLLSMEDDSIDGIYNTLKDCANISKWAGGIGLHIHNIRAQGSHIRGTNGSSNGIVPMLKVFNNTAKYVDQCVTGDTLIRTTSGFLPIQEVVPGRTRIVNRHVSEPANFAREAFLRANEMPSEKDGPVPVSISHKGYDYAVKVVKYPEYEGILHSITTTAHGRPLRVTPQHPILVQSKDEEPVWADAAEVKPGDFIVNETGSFLVTENFAEHYTGPLYDLEMETYPNYMTIHGLLHNGGGKRNGSFAIYLEPWHADIEMYLQMRKNHGDEELKARDLFYALWIPDLFMERVKNGGKWTLMCPDECPGLSDVHSDAFVELYTRYEEEGRGKKTVQARDLWFQVLDAQMETGTPYLLYKDAANKKSNQKNLGTIKSSNLCVAPETLVLTDKGHIPIGTLENQEVNVWNGEEWSNVTVKKTGENQELIEVHTDDGMSISCTKYHKFYIQNSYSDKDVQVKDAKDLQLGDKIIKCTYPVIHEGSEKMNYVYTHGFFCGDGTYDKNLHNTPERCKFKCMNGHFFCKRHIDFAENNTQIYEDANQCNAISYVKKPLLRLYGEKTKLIEYLEYRYMSKYEDVIALCLPLNIEEKFYVPLNCDLPTRLEWFAGLCDADGCISNNGTNQQLQIASINYEFLTNVKLMLQTCGVNAKIKLMHKPRKVLLPNGKGGSDYYDCKEIYRLLITSCELCHLVSIGFSPKRLEINEHVPNRNAKQFIKISKLIDNERISDTYCFTEPKLHRGVFNGILTGQCTEIIEYSDKNETAVCNLASIALPMFVNTYYNNIDHAKLHKVTKIVTRNLNNVIDINYYPTEKTRRSNMRHRPIGLGVQGLADTFLMLVLPFCSDDAKRHNREIFETIYHAALEASCELAEEYGPYETFAGSPASKGQLQFDMWNVTPDSGRYDWSDLKSRIQANGLRNSLLLAPMPTASTSQILGYNECIEPITSNIYSRRTMAGEFILANKYLMTELIGLRLWDEKVKNSIIANNGSIQQIDTIPQEIREKYKTVWELPMKHIIDMAADRGAYICQSQSLNLWIEDPNYNTLTSMHFYAWSKGLKTGIYYLRRRAKHQAQQFTIEPEKRQQEEDHEICELCSS